jgi:competence protein ComEC
LAALALAMAGAALLCWWRPLPLRPLGVAWLLPMLLGARYDREELRVTVMDVGQGLAVLVQTAGHALLYDAGPAFRMRDAGESVVLPVLRRSGVARLDALVISHDDMDHAGGARTVLAAHPETPLVATSAGELPAQSFRPCRTGRGWVWDGVRFEVISPKPGARWHSDNDGSCVLRVSAPHGSLLLPGDIERDREQQLVADGLSPAELVVAPHHGSRSSSSSEFATALRPAWVLFSAAYGNRWGFPAREVVQRWQDLGTCPMETAEAGAIVMTAREGGWHLERRERIDGAHIWTAAGRIDECTRSREQ